MRAKSITGCLAIAALTFLLPPIVGAQPSGGAAAALRAGAARIDYTPRELPGNFAGVLDPIFVRTLVLDNGTTRAALVAIDAGAIPGELYDKVSARAAAELEIPAAQLLMSASHTHSVPFRLDLGVEETIMRGLRDATRKVQILAEINCAHPALAKFFNNSIMRNSLTDHAGSRSVGTFSGQRVLELGQLCDRISGLARLTK